MKVNKVHAELSVKRTLPNVYSFPVTFGVWGRVESGVPSDEDMRGLWGFVEGVIDYHFRLALGQDVIALPPFPVGIIPETVFLAVGAKRDLPPDVLSYGPGVGFTVTIEPGDDMTDCVMQLSQLARHNMRSSFLRAIGKEDYGLNLGLANARVTVETD